jgi:hypothetical protein
MKLRERGRSSEKLSPEDIRQGSLFDEAELYSVAESADAPTEVVRITKTVYTRRKRGRKPIDPKLSRIEVVVDLTEAEKVVGDGFELVRIGEETSEQVHEVPQKYIVIRTVRPKYVVRRAYAAADDDDQIASEIRVAPMPPHIRACKKFCVNGYTTPRSEYGYYQGNPGRVAEGLQRAG